MRNSPLRSSQPSYADSSRGRDASLPVGTCTAVIGSMTQAMKAQGLLADAAIRGSIAKVSAAGSHGGCAYGVAFSCIQSANVRSILDRAGIRVREYLKG